ncbi:quinone oxidoreductase family protein [Thioflexithrix psekupsensis]|uniref:NADPH:quinone reductase n=1 Tax=Thioflexithrix psekupsensis TaxID=1570016 RepID=A0A251XAR7_9GAMM|nr:quinone oxidoreductase [Thioflexithrix psekupsensis]OUD15459.1 quinone oxidoreductase [Thioflexithrix psekupsensis]
MAHAIRIHKTGGTEVLQWEEIEVGQPAARQLRLKQTAIGLNFIDIYFRTGLYRAAQLPFIPGMEAAGVVAEVGADVTEFAVGDRVAYAPIMGAYTQERLIDADKVVKLPDTITDEVAAAIMLKGMTAYYLLRQTYCVKPGDTILIHAAAGGVGLLVCQWAKHLGATVIGTVGNEAKAALAKANGCDYPIVYTKEDFVQRVKTLTDGRGVAVVYDSVGKDTFMASLDCLRPLGMMVSFGQASGAVDPLELSVLSQKGSLFLTRPTLMDYTATHSQLVTCANGLFEALAQGALSIAIPQRFALADAAHAHAALESRQTTGATLLLP